LSALSSPADSALEIVIPEMIPSPPETSQTNPVDPDGAPNKATKERLKRGPARTTGIVPRELLSRKREKEVPSLLVSRERSLVPLVTSRAHAIALSLRVVPDLREVAPRVVAPLLANRSSGGKLVRPLTLLVKVARDLTNLRAPHKKVKGISQNPRAPSL
jgi:hypothetical protein